MSRIVGIQERVLRVLVAALALLGGDGDGGFLAGELSGTGHGAAVDDDAGSCADRPADEHAKVVDHFVAEGHGVACFGDDGETAADEDVNEKLGSRNEVAESLVKVKADTKFYERKRGGGGFSYVDSAVEITKERGDMLGMVARKPLLKLKGRGQNLMPVK